MGRTLIISLVIWSFPLTARADPTPTPITRPCVIDGTAVATPTPSGPDFGLSDLSGFRSGVSRSFTAPGLRLLDTLGFQFAVLLFVDESSASQAITDIPKDLLSAAPADTSAIRRASIESMGDERSAYSGRIVATNPKQGEIDTAVVAIVVVRTEGIVRLGYGYSLVTDPLPDVASSLKKALSRQPSNNRIQCDADGFHRGGLWEALPALDDIPNGFVLSGEDWT